VVGDNLRGQVTGERGLLGEQRGEGVLQEAQRSSKRDVVLVRGGIDLW
jgi:hypothetical protein